MQNFLTCFIGLALLANTAFAQTQTELAGIVRAPRANSYVIYYGWLTNSPQGDANEAAWRIAAAAPRIAIVQARTAAPAGHLNLSPQVLAALHQGKIDFGVFAIQNARGGVVMETIHALSKYDCEILEIFDIVISHCLLRHPEADFDEIDTIISHPQALAQCADTLGNKYPQLKLTSGEGDLIDQALCARYVAEGKLPASTAVLAPKVCAELYGLKIHDTDLQDLGQHTRTTFVWARRRHYFRK